MVTIELFGRVNDHGELEIEQPSGLHVSLEGDHWGKNLIALLDQLDLSAWESENIDDPVEWVRQRRQEQARRRNLDWGKE